MPHADSSLVPQNITTKAAFYDHITKQLESLLDGQRFWVSNLSNTASLLFNSYLAFPEYFGLGEKMINWCGFYLESSLVATTTSQKTQSHGLLLLGPFSGKPACQFIRTQAGRGVCADAFVSQKTILVPNVDLYPGHIACDGETKSEVVVPLVYGSRAIGVLDLDCLGLGGFDEVDREGLERIAGIIVNACDWDSQ